MPVSQVSNVVSQLTNLLIQEVAFLRGVRDQIKWVETELRLLQGFLKDADAKRKRGDERMESWIREIRDVAYEVEDIIDRVKFMAERQHQRRGFMDTISRYSHKPRELFTLHEIGSEIGNIKERIRGISESKDRYGIANLGESSAVDESSQSLRESSPRSDDDDIEVIGFENDKKEIVSQLLDGNEKARCVISIVGMGGLGKTTLARKVYNDPAIREHFNTFAWVSVSQSYGVIELAKDIMKKVMGIKKKKEMKHHDWKDMMKEVMGIKKKEETTTEITEEGLEQMGEEEVREKLSDFLRDKKYLVVMDDVWRVDVWREMQQVFPNENNGSRILLTTRNIEVARDAQPWITPHELQLLNDAESLKLFHRKAFPPNQDVPTELEALAQKLAKKCGGLPLALVVLGGLLSRKDRSYNEWWRVAQSMNWEDSRDGKECLNILGLSYNDLPDPLKPCFLYIAAFPEDSIISASKLVRLWVAEGFIPEEQRRTMEETARVWLDNLVQRCMIQVVSRSMVHGWVKSIRIHDMLRDFGQSEARRDRFLQIWSSDNMAVSDGISRHRAAFHNRINDEVAVSSPHLRTLLGFNLILTNGRRFLNGLNLLRVLDLEGAKHLKVLPKQIESMIHLRYLGLRKTGLKRLPSSIRHLLNLQTLDARDTRISRLPKSFWKIRMLRHVYINMKTFLITPPIIGDYNNLQTLRIRMLGDVLAFRDPRLFFITLLALAWLGELSGKTLKKMDSLNSVTLVLRFQITGDVLFAQAPNLHQLHSLTLWGRLSLEPQQQLPDSSQFLPNLTMLRSLFLDGRLSLKPQQQLPDSSQFPPNLTKLILWHSGLEQDPMPVLEKLPNLRFLQLNAFAYVGKSMSCSSAGGFPRLQHLILFLLNNLMEWRVEAGAMPSLTHLTIQHCRKLKMLPEGLQHVTTLTHLTINHCEMLKMLPERLQQVTTLRRLKLIFMPRELNNRVRNTVRHIPSIIFEHELSE